MEEWRKIPGAPEHYEVSSLGNFRRLPHEVPYGRRAGAFKAKRKGGSVTPFDDGRYLQVTVNRNTVHLHRLVLLAFAGPPGNPTAECRHLNGDGKDNRVDNLAWGSPHENQMDRHAHGTACRGEDGYQATMREADVRRIVALRADGLGPSAISRTTGLPLSRVKSVAYGLSWCWLTGIRAASKQRHN